MPVDDGEFKRYGHVVQTFTWSTHAAALAFRGQLPAGGVRLYAQLSFGIGFAGTDFRTDDATASLEESYIGFYLVGDVGLIFVLSRAVNLYLQSGMHYAPVISNEIGDVRNGAGSSVMLGLLFMPGAL